MLAIIADNKWVYINQIIGSIEPLLVKWFSARHPRIQFIDTSQQNWDGWYRKFDARHSRIARPLLGELIKFAENHKLPLEICDKRVPSKFNPQYHNTMLSGGIVLTDYQMAALETVHPEKNECGVISVPTGGGKCLGKGTPIIMFDGSIKNVEDIKVGDVLMGDDSTPRKVLSTCTDTEELFKVKQLYGDDYVVNKSHILSLKTTPYRKGAQRKICDISLSDYFKLSKYKKHILKSYKVPVKFRKKKVPFDPYLLGLWLGDGLKRDLTFSVGYEDPEIVDYLRKYCIDNDYKLVKYIDPGERADFYSVRLYEGIRRPISFGNSIIRNPLKEDFRKLNLFHNKHVPDVFKFNSDEVRLKVLAGFIDADGHHHNNGFDITHRRGRLINDIAYIARSLGFRASMNNNAIKRCTTTGYVGTYSRINITGHTNRVPVILPRKKCLPRKQKKDALVCGFKIEPLGVGQYFGFEIDGNKRFLLGDFTVTHNTEILAAITKAYGVPTVIIAGQRVVIEQIKERLELRDVVNHSDGIGLFYGGSRPNGQTVVVGSIQSLTSPSPSLKRKDLKQWKKRNTNAKIFQDIVKGSGLLLVDECDRATDKRYRQLFMKYFKGRFKYGFSGTPFDKDKPVEALILKEHMGSVIYEVSRRDVEKAGRIIPIRAVMIQAGDPSGRSERTAYDIAQRELLIENDVYHQRINQIVEAFPDDRTMILVDTNNVEELGKVLELKIKGSTFIYGKTSTKKRREAINAFQDGKLKCLIGGKILKRGLDIKGGVHNLIICGGGKLHSDFDQKVGRAVRKNDRGFARLFCFFHLDNYYLYKHSKEQLKSIISMGYGVKVLINGVSIDGSELIKRKFRLPK